MPTTTNLPYIPNPANQLLTLHWRMAQMGETLSWQLTDLLGRTWLRGSEKGPEGQVDLPTAALPAGIYLVRLRAGASETNLRVVVQH